MHYGPFTHLHCILPTSFLPSLPFLPPLPSSLSLPPSMPIHYIVNLVIPTNQFPTPLLPVRTPVNLLIPPNQYPTPLLPVRTPRELTHTPQPSPLLPVRTPPSPVLCTLETGSFQLASWRTENTRTILTPTALGGQGSYVYSEATYSSNDIASLFQVLPLQISPVVFAVDVVNEWLTTEELSHGSVGRVYRQDRHHRMNIR